MPSFCCVVKCGSRGMRDNVRFFRIPKSLNFKFKKHLNELSLLRRQKWIAAIKRADLTETKLKYAQVCSKHFVPGEPAKLEDCVHPDWVPSLNMGYENQLCLQSTADKKIKRYLRFKKRLNEDTPSCSFQEPEEECTEQEVEM